MLPFVLAAIVVPLAVWRSSKGPAPVRTSDILATGVPAEGELVSVRQLGGPIDVRPMLRFTINVQSDEPFELEVVQSFPRGTIRDFHAGDRIKLRLTADRSAGAVVWDGGMY